MHSTIVTVAIETEEPIADPGAWDWAALLDVSTANAVAVRSTTAPLVTEPLTEDDVEHLTEDDEDASAAYQGPKKVAASSSGFVSVVVKADIFEMFRARVVGGSDEDEHDYLHRLAFTFGFPNQSEYEVLGVSGGTGLVGGGVLVEYSTDLTDFTSADTDADKDEGR